MATKKSEVKEETKETVDIESLMAQIKADLMKELEEKTKALDKREKELEKKEKENRKKAIGETIPMQKIDETREVMVKTLAHGTTTLRGREYDYPFSAYGEEMPISIKELRFIKSTTPRVFTKPLVVVDDEEACKILGTKQLYEKLDCVIDIQGFCERHTEEEIKESLMALPQFIRFELFSTLVALWNKDGSEQYRDYDLARVLRKYFKFDLLSYEKDAEK